MDIQEIDAIFSAFLEIPLDDTVQIVQEGLALLPLLIQSNQAVRRAEVRCKIGVAQMYQGEYESALVSLTEARHIFEKHEMDQKAMETQLALAVTYVTSGQIGTGLELLHLMLDQARKQELVETESSAFFHLGKIYAEIGHLERGMTFLRSALKLNNTIKSQRRKADIFVEMGMIELHRSRIDPAERLLKAALRIESSLNRETRCGTSMAMAQLYIQTNNYGEAEKLITETLERCRKKQLVRSEIVALYQQGLLLHITGRRDDAERSFRDCYQQSEKHSYRHMKIKSGEALGKIYREKQLFDKALNCLDKVRETEQEIQSTNPSTAGKIWSQNTRIYNLEQEMNVWKRRSGQLEQIQNEKEQAIRELKYVSRIGEKITASLTPETIIDMLYSELAQLIDLDCLFVARYNPDCKELEIRYIINEGQRMEPKTVVLNADGCLSYWVIENNTDLMINSYEESAGYTQKMSFLFDSGEYNESIMIIRLKLEDRIIGILSVQSELKNCYRERHLEILQALGGFLAIALTNAEVHQTLLNANKKIAHLASHDALTDLPNRTRIMERLKQEIGRCERYSLTLAVLFVDLDGFKGINDNYGHNAGDVLLREMATRLKERLRTTDAVGRLGGDEFLVILTDNCTPGDARTLAEELQHSLAAPVQFKGQELKVTASIGLAMYPVDSINPEELVNIADTAMYTAKENGKNQICLADATAALT